MPVEQLGDSNGRYLNIVGGKLAQKVNEGTEGSVRRDYELKDGTKGTKWEINYKNLTGFITEMLFKQTEFGEMFSIKIEMDGEVDLLTLNTDSKYFSDFARKLPNIDLSKQVTMNPFDFEADGKKLRGLSIVQEGEKVKDHYFDYDKKKYDFIRLYVQKGNRSEGRNYGASRAKGDILAFIDADCIANAFWTRELQKSMKKAEVVAGKSIRLGYHGFMDLERVGMFHKDTDVTYPSCNLAYKKSVFDEINGLSCDEKASQTDNFFNKLESLHMDDHKPLREIPEFTKQDVIFLNALKQWGI